jgi:radical SAM superfamily enzyme YgiQ (UPF0313 family)
MTIYLVKPHPPVKILRRKTPVPESYRYDWEPFGLKMLADALDARFRDEVRVKVWHLMDASDDKRMLEAAAVDRPLAVFFTEIDVLVNEANRLAELLKKSLPSCVAVTGGKQSSLLKPGDIYPFRSVDYSVKGDGLTATAEIVEALRTGKPVENVTGVFYADKSGKTTGGDTAPAWTRVRNIDGVRIRSIPVENHTFEEYFTERMHFPSTLEGDVRTAAIFTGTGCKHRCFFCQSTLEEKNVQHREPKRIAEEVAWLYRNHKIRNFFSLEDNLSLENLDAVFHELDATEVHGINFSGFIRAADVVRAGDSGLLKSLAAKGVRFLSIGLDVPPDTKTDIYNKSFSSDAQDRCLEACLEAGVAPLVTFIASPEIDATTFERQLSLLAKMPVASVDIRIAIALRNTPYFERYRGSSYTTPTATAAITTNKITVTRPSSSRGRSVHGRPTGSRTLLPPLPDLAGTHRLPDRARLTASRVHPVHPQGVRWNGYVRRRDRRQVR